jgi:hypothetical protein
MLNIFLFKSFPHIYRYYFENYNFRYLCVYTMCAATYRDREDNSREPINISASFDTDVDNVADDKPDAAAEYLEKSLGDVLGEVLAECALKRPDDAITFVANEFQRFKTAMIITFIIISFRREKEIQEKTKAGTSTSRISAGLSATRYQFRFKILFCSYAFLILVCLQQPQFPQTPQGRM